MSDLQRLALLAGALLFGAVPLVLESTGCAFSPSGTVRCEDGTDPPCPCPNGAERVDGICPCEEGAIRNEEGVCVATPGEPNSYTCGCTCGFPDGKFTRLLDVCLPPEHNPNLGGAVTTGDVDEDCTFRVQETVEEMHQQCLVADPLDPNDFDCNCIVTGIPDVAFRAECDMTCPDVPLADDCSNYNPDDMDLKQAGATRFLDPDLDVEGPVCFAAETDPPVPLPEPAAASLRRRSSLCEVGGTATLFLGDADPRDTGMTGLVAFRGEPCPGAECEVGVSFDFEIDPLKFDGFLGFRDVHFERMRGSGDSLPEAASLNALGMGSIGSAETFTSAQGRRREERVIGDDKITKRSYGATNLDDINVFAGWQDGTCSIAGAFVGALEGDGGEATPLDVFFTPSSGQLVNQPPAASAGSDQVLECTSPAGALVGLTGGWADPDHNVVATLWRAGSGPGQLLGRTAELDVEQALGSSATYAFTAIDAFGQVDVDSAFVSVADTTAPSLTEPADVTAECADAAGTTVSLGDASASDVCDDSVDIFHDAPASFALGSTDVTWTAADDSGNVSTAIQTVTIVDTTPPEIACNAPTTIDPTQGADEDDPAAQPVSFTATATDVCDTAVEPAIVSFNCLKFTNKGRRIDKTESCVVSVLEDTVTILDSGGVGDRITWQVRATDGSGNETAVECGVDVVRRSKS